jgi:hypothetical protein
MGAAAVSDTATHDDYKWCRNISGCYGSRCKGALAFLPKPRTDFDADVKNDSGAYRNGIWFIRRSLDGAVISVGWEERRVT